MDAEKFIQHYGVPGMKWGRRKSSGGSSFTTAVAKSTKTQTSRPSWQRSPNRKPATVDAPTVKKLSKRQQRKLPKPLSADAVEFRALKVKIKKDGLGSLNNNEVRAINSRFQLEKQFKDNFPKKQSPLVKAFLDDAIFNIGKEVVIPLLPGKITTNTRVLQSIPLLMDLRKSRQKPKKKD